jgi:hypothetical protein
MEMEINSFNDDIFDDNLGYWENRFWKDYGWIPRLDTQRGIDELQEYKRECSIVLT